MRTELTERMSAQGKLNKEETEDTVLDLLIMAYVFGTNDADELLGTDIGVNTDKLKEALYRKFEDRDFADRIAEYVKANDIEGIMRVVDTEMHRDYSAGLYDTAESSGKQVMKTWVTMEDFRVRETHWYLHNVTVPLEDRFYTFDGDSARYPGDFSTAEENCNCRCYLTVKAV